MYQTSLNRSRNDKFIMVLDIPKSVKNLYSQIYGENYSADPIQFSIYGSPVPTITVPDKDIAFGGQVLKTSSFSRPAYNPLTVRFLVDNGYKNYWIIWNWLNVLNNAKTSTSEAHELLNPPIVGNIQPILKNSFSDYSSQFSIFGLDEYNNKIISFKYSNSFPTSLGEINFSNQDPSEINCTATFAFNQLQVDLIKNVDQVSC